MELGRAPLVLEEFAGAAGRERTNGYRHWRFISNNHSTSTSQRLAYVQKLLSALAKECLNLHDRCRDECI